MNYIGSKLSLLEFLEESINKVAGKNCDTFCDLFAGTGIVGRYFKTKGYKIIANDIQYYSYVLNRHYIGNHKELNYANTASVYGAFLKKLKKTAQNNLILKPAELIINDQDHEVFNEDINKVAGKIAGDILYLDPPYNQRQYATNYHMLETIAKYDNPKIHGKTGLREYQNQKSLYCSRTQVKKAFKDLILKARAKYIFLSYNNEGLMTLGDIQEIMSLRGKYGNFTKEYNRFKADKSENRSYTANKTVEYLHYVVCKNV